MLTSVWEYTNTDDPSVATWLNASGRGVGTYTCSTRSHMQYLLFRLHQRFWANEISLFCVVCDGFPATQPSHIPHIAPHEHMHSMYAAHLDGLAHTPALETLVLRDNAITAPDGLYRCPELWTIDLAGNKV